MAATDIDLTPSSRLGTLPGLRIIENDTLPLNDVVRMSPDTVAAHPATASALRARFNDGSVLSEERQLTFDNPHWGTF